MVKNPTYHAYMENLTFLPDGKPVSAFILAQLPYDRETVEKITLGTSPQQFPIRDNTRPTWGLLYIRDSEIGFFVHASESPMGTVFRSTRRGNELKELHLRIDSSHIKKAEIRKPREPLHWFSRFIDFITPTKDDFFDLVWKQNNEEQSLTFFCLKIPAEFEESVKLINPQTTISH